MNSFDNQHTDNGSPAELPRQRHHNVLTDDIIAAIDMRLGQLPPRKTLTVETAIKRLSPRVKKMREIGYTSAEVVDELNKELCFFNMKMKVSVRSLARHLPVKSKTSINIPRDLTDRIKP